MWSYVMAAARSNVSRRTGSVFTVHTGNSCGGPGPCRDGLNSCRCVSKTKQNSIKMHAKFPGYNRAVAASSQLTTRSKYCVASPALTSIRPCLAMGPGTCSPRCACRRLTATDARACRRRLSIILRRWVDVVSNNVSTVLRKRPHQAGKESKFAKWLFYYAWSRFSTITLAIKRFATCPNSIWIN